jgi:hypothetical protein
MLILFIFIIFWPGGRNVFFGAGAVYYDGSPLFRGGTPFMKSRDPSGGYGISAPAKAAADHAALKRIAPDIAAFPDGVGIIAGPPVIPVIVVAIRAEGIIP